MGMDMFWILCTKRPRNKLVLLSISPPWAVWAPVSRLLAGLRGCTLSRFSFLRKYLEKSISRKTLASRVFFP